jgi:hypothetical protein
MRCNKNYERLPGAWRRLQQRLQQDSSLILYPTILDPTILDPTILDPKIRTVNRFRQKERIKNGRTCLVRISCHSINKKRPLLKRKQIESSAWRDFFRRNRGKNRNGTGEKPTKTKIVRLPRRTRHNWLCINTYGSVKERERGGERERERDRIYSILMAGRIKTEKRDSQYKWVRRRVVFTMRERVGVGGRGRERRAKR